MPPESKDSRAGLTYAQSGVDIDAGNALVKAIKPLAAATARRGASAELGGFGGLFDLKAAGYRDPILVATTDGVGTKVKIAIETGRFDTIGVDLVAMCVNDLVVQGAEPLFFLDYYACAELRPAIARSVIAGIAAACREAGAALIGGETAEMPGLYASGDFDLAGFAVGAVGRRAVLPRKGMKAGDIILGIASCGVHSNGFSLVRRIVSETGLRWDAPAPFEPGQTLGEALLTPTRIYVRPILAALKSAAGTHLLALAHITGGGLPDNIARALPDKLAARIDLGAFTPPPVFGWLAREGKIALDEMLRTFNCGIGMAAIVSAKHAKEIAQILSKEGEQVFEIGKIVRREKTGEGAGAAVQMIGTLELGE